MHTHTARFRIRFVPLLAVTLAAVLAVLALWQGGGASPAADAPAWAAPVEAASSTAQQPAAQQPAPAPQQATAREGAASEGAAGTIAYTYDDAGRLIRVEYGPGVSVSYTYDSAGNLLRREVVREHRQYLPDVRR